MSVKNTTLLILVIFLSTAAIIIADDDQKKAAASITIEELKEHLTILASDDFQGRRPGTEGYQKAAAYAAEQFRISGLKTLYTDQDGNPSFLQPLKMVKTSHGPNNSLIMKRGDVTEEFGKEHYFLFRPGKEQVKEYEPLEVAFVGYGIYEPEAEYDDYKDVDIEGKIAVLMMGAPISKGKFVLPQEISKKYMDPLGGSVPKLKAAFDHKAAGVIVIAMPAIAFQWEKLTRQIGKLNISAAPAEAKEGEEPDEFAVAINPPAPLLAAHPKMINKLFEGQQYQPITRKGEYKAFILKDVTLKMNIDMPIQPFTSYNIVALVEGSDPVLKQEYITIGAHLDHLGILDDGVANGADDNGSGSVAILELAEALAISPPKRSVILVLYTSEELGLIGSKYFADHPPVPLENLIVNINMDMIGRDCKEFPEGVFAIGSTRLSQEFKPLIIAANENSVNIPLSFTFDQNDPENHWSRSDQINFHRKGIPVVFFTSGSHEDYHKATDDVEKIDFEKISSVSKLCYQICIDLGEKEKRLALAK